MSKSAICKNCTEAGFPNETITFEKNGTKPDGSIKWKPVNPDGSEHKHKEKAATSGSSEPKVDGMTDLAAAVRELAAAIRSRPV